MSIDDFLHKFQQALAVFSHYEESLWMALQPHASIKRLRKNSILPARSYDAYMVAAGMVHLQESDDANILHFITKGAIVPDTYLNQGQEYLALEDTILIVIPKDTLAALHRTNPDFYYLERDIIRQWFVYMTYPQKLLNIPKQERKAAFKKLFPQVSGQVPNILIARYLSMSAEYFSRTGW